MQTTASVGKDLFCAAFGNLEEDFQDGHDTRKQVNLHHCNRRSWASARRALAIGGLNSGECSDDETAARRLRTVETDQYGGPNSSYLRVVGSTSRWHLHRNAKQKLRDKHRWQTEDLVLQVPRSSSVSTIRFKPPGLPVAPNSSEKTCQSSTSCNSPAEVAPQSAGDRTDADASKPADVDIELDSDLDSQGHRSVTIAFPSGEPLLQATYACDDDSVMLLVRQVQDVVAEQFTLLTSVGEVLPGAGESSSKRIIDFDITEGSVLTLVVGQMNMAGRNRLSRSKRLERDIKSFTSFLENAKMYKTATKRAFERFKGTRDLDLGNRLGQELVYMINAQTCIGELSARVCLSGPSWMEVRDVMEQSMATGNGALNLNDFRIYYRTMVERLIANLKVELENENCGQFSHEGWMRTYLDSCEEFATLTLGAFGETPCKYRFWKAGASVQCAKVVASCFIEFFDGTFEIQGSNIKFHWEKRLRTHFLAGDTDLPHHIVELKRFAIERYRQECHARKYQPRRNREVPAEPKVSISDLCSRASLAPWTFVSMSQHGTAAISAPRDMKVQQEGLALAVHLHCEAGSQDAYVWHRVGRSQLRLKPHEIVTDLAVQVENAMMTNGFSHPDAGAQGLLA